ncbi:MAG: HNH endonuclease, partial [Candidatus Methylomirabilia bacterium]
SPRVVRSPSISFTLPAVIRLAMYIRKPFLDRVAFNKKNILRRDSHACQYCGRRGERLTVDHIVPRSRGGETTWTNVVAACLRCNLQKGNRTLREARMALIREPSYPRFLFAVHLSHHPHAGSFLDSWRKYLVAVPSAR